MCYFKVDVDGVLWGYFIVSVEDNVVLVYYESVLKVIFNSSVDISDGILLFLKIFVFNYGLVVV